MKTVLLIDENLLIVENLQEAFELEGYRVLAAFSSMEGIRMAKQYQPDLIVAEILMAGMNGFELLHSINSIPGINEIPFMFCTTKCEKADKSKALELGARDYVIKPFELDQLYQAARALVQ